MHRKDLTIRLLDVTVQQKAELLLLDSYEELRKGKDMEKVLYAQLMLMNVLVLFVIWHSDTYRIRGPVMISQRLFRVLIWVDIIAIVCDVVQVVCEGMLFQFNNFVQNATILLYYLLHCAVAFIFGLYVDYELYPDTERFKKRIRYYTIPIIFNSFMSIASLWTGWYFRIDETNSYVRGPMFYLPVVISCGYVMYILFMLLKYKKEKLMDGNMQKELYTRLFIFPLISCVGALLQILMPGTAWIFPTTTLAILINYTTVQNGYMARDHLTGLYNRSQLESFMNYQLKNLKRGHYFFLILIDLDKFKEINDTLGHVVGDDALINAAKLLRGSCKRKADYVARLGGDEFVIIGQCQEVAAVDLIITRMHDVFSRFNKVSRKPYRIQFSAGYTVYDGSNQATLDMLISEADHKMYDIKNAKKMKEKI